MEIHFKRQQLGKWRRKDGDTTKHVNEDQMHRELQKLVNDGFRLNLFGSKVDGRLLSVIARKD